MGVNVQTRYQQIYTTAMSDVQTTMDVDTTPAFTTGYGTIRRGYADQEDIKWRGITGLQLTSLLRGLSPTALTDTEVLGLKKTHSLQSSTALQTFEGTTIHYIINNKTDVDDDETISGNWNFSAKPKMTGIKDSSGNESIDLDATASAVNQLRVVNSATGTAVTVTTAGDDTNIDNLISAKGTGKVKLKDGAEMASAAAPTTNAGIANKKYVDDIAAAGASGDETTAGKWEGATVAEQGTATDLGGTGSHLVPMNKNLVKTSSGASDENKIPVLDATGKFAGGFIPAILTTFVDAKGDLVTASADNTPARQAVGSNNQVLIADSSQANGIKWGIVPLEAGNFKSGKTTRVGNAASGTQTIAHGLGRKPAWVEMDAFFGSGTMTVDAVAMTSANGSFDGTTTVGIFGHYYNDGSTVGGVITGGSSTNILTIYSKNTSADRQECTIAIDATNITLTWTKTGSPAANNIDIHWKVFG